MSLFYEQKLGDSILRATGLAESMLPNAVLRALRSRLDRFFVTISADVKPDQPCTHRKPGGTGTAGPGTPPPVEGPLPPKETPPREGVETLPGHCCDIKSVSASEESFTVNLEVSVSVGSVKLEGGFTVKPVILNPTPLGNCPEECTNERVDTAISFRFTFRLKISGSISAFDAQPGASSTTPPTEIDLGPLLGKTALGGTGIAGTNAQTLDAFAIGGGAAAEFTGTDNLVYTITCSGITHIVTKPAVGGSAAAGSGAPGASSTGSGGAGAAAGTAAAVSPCDEPASATLIGDADVQREIERAWQESNPNAREVPSGDPGSTKVEQGGWIIYNETTGRFRVQRVAHGRRDSMNLGDPPAVQPPECVVAWFHTHPNTAREGYWGAHDLSPQDERTFNRLRLRSGKRMPTILRGHGGTNAFE
ncbi:MAG: hypothetical protein K2Y40_24055 [Reyranella sp.]|nr:hypothetical protein [Reyranella sp.]